MDRPSPDFDDTAARWNDASGDASRLLDQHEALMNRRTSLLSDRRRLMSEIVSIGRRFIAQAGGRR